MADPLEPVALPGYRLGWAAGFVALCAAIDLLVLTGSWPRGAPPTGVGLVLMVASLPPAAAFVLAVAVTRRVAFVDDRGLHVRSAPFPFERRHLPRAELARIVVERVERIMSYGGGHFGQRKPREGWSVFAETPSGDVWLVSAELPSEASAEAVADRLRRRLPPSEDADRPRPAQDRRAPDEVLVR